MNKRMCLVALGLTFASLVGCASGPRYKNVRSFSEGLAPVQANNGKWGYINDKNIFIIPPRYEDAKEFKDGKAAVKINGRWGFINKKGAWL